MYVSVKNFDYKSIISGNLNGETEEKRFAKFNGLSEKQIDLMIDERKATHPSKYIVLLSISIMLLTVFITGLSQSANMDHDELYGQIQILAQTKRSKQLSAEEQEREIKGAIKKANKIDLSDTNTVAKITGVTLGVFLAIIIFESYCVWKSNSDLHELYTYRRILEDNKEKGSVN